MMMIKTIHIKCNYLTNTKFLDVMFYNVKSSKDIFVIPILLIMAAIQVLIKNLYICLIFFLKKIVF